MARRPSPSAGPAAPPAPGASPLTFLHGDFAAAQVGGVTFNIFDWTVESRTITVDSRGHGERYRRPVPVSSEWTFRGRGYITAGSTSHALNAGFANDGADPPTNIQVIGYSGSTGGTPIFTGTGVMTRGTIEAPDGGMAVQEIEIEGFGTPTVGV